MTVAAIPAIDLVAPQIATRSAAVEAAATIRPMSFKQLLMRGVETTSAKLSEADRLLARSVVDDTIPLHQVTYALEEARISFELMILVRNRLLDASQQLTNMQL